MTALLRPALVLFTSLGLLTGVLYPLLVTALGQSLFPEAATGSLIRDGGRVLGSTRIGQAFSDPRFFWSRPSATAPVPYNAAASTGTNLGPSNPALHVAVAGRIEALRAAGAPDGPVPADLVTASGSGLDPHISPAAAAYQAERVARARGIPLATVRTLIDAHTEPRAFGVLGEPRVHVLQLNLALDRIPQRANDMRTSGSESM
ncbi:MAG: potassium-transporting ATPase subunit KdpC [Myxococcota bacterium]